MTEPKITLKAARENAEMMQLNGLGRVNRGL